MRKTLNEFGDWAADKLSQFVGTWTFIIIYTAMMITWMMLHNFGILHIDTPDFIKWNLLLSYYAGIQASIMMMSAERVAIRDRRRAEHTLRNTKEQTEQLKDITGQLEQMENVIESLYEEVQAKKEHKTHDK